MIPASPSKGTHSVGVARQYCGQTGKKDNCRVAVSLSGCTASASLPIANGLYLPESLSEDAERRRKTGVPDGIEFRTKPLIAAEQIRQALADGVPPAPVVADAAYGNDTKFRQAILDLELNYVVGIHPTLSLWPPGQEPLPPKPRQSTGRPPKLRQRSRDHQPVPARELAGQVAATAWKTVTFRSAVGRIGAAPARRSDRDYSCF